jgi:hypothetical protein
MGGLCSSELSYLHKSWFSSELDLLSVLLRFNLEEDLLPSYCEQLLVQRKKHSLHSYGLYFNASYARDS